MTSAAQSGFESDPLKVLTDAWKNVFRRTSVGVNENFFELGGDSSLATVLFTEISCALGREISPVLISHAPTIASLNTLLQYRGPISLPAVTPLRAGDSASPPILMFHGCGATVLDLFRLANSIQAPNSIYGLQDPGTDGFTKPFERIADIAEYHLQAIKQQKIRGPYLLIGYSAGGLVTLEIANRLKKIGDTIALLVMIDSFLPISALPPYRVLGVKARREAHRLAVSVRRSTIPGTRGRERMHVATDLQPSRIGECMRRFQEAERQALENYRGQYYGGRVRFVRAKSSWTFPLDPRKMWASFIPNMTVETSLGDHTGLVSTHYGDLAVRLSRYIAEALCNNSL